MHKSGVEDLGCGWTFTIIDWREEVRKYMKKRHTANYTSVFPQQTCVKRTKQPISLLSLSYFLIICFSIIWYHKCTFTNLHLHNVSNFMLLFANANSIDNKRFAQRFQLAVFSLYLLVGQKGVALQGGQVTTEQSSTWSVMLTKDGAVDVVKSVTRHQAISTCGTSETLGRRKKKRRAEIQSIDC